MFAITAYTVESIPDKFGILAGKRYEFVLDIELDEEDELYSENGVTLRVIFKTGDGEDGIAHTEFLEKTTGRYLEFEPDDEELELVAAFCRDRFHEAEEEA